MADVRQVAVEVLGWKYEYGDVRQVAVEVLGFVAPVTIVHLNVAGVWKPCTTHINVAGVWKQTTPLINVGGVWK